VRSITVSLLLGVGLTSCYPAEGPDPAHLPSCFANGTPQARSGKAVTRLRWVHLTDGGFAARNLTMSIDGGQVYTSRDEPTLERELVELVDVEVEPGPHRLSSVALVSGRGRGLFAYLQDYRKELQQQQAFELAPGAVSCWSMVLSYRGGLTVPVEERPTAVLIEERAP
jgi:hypothetical protein